MGLFGQDVMNFYVFNLFIMKKLIWVEVNYSTWKKDEKWEIEFKKLWLISFPHLSDNSNKKYVKDVVEDVLKTN